jgi:response regulator RpfG family c-di-GMP phosphodiesterase
MELVSAASQEATILYVDDQPSHRLLFEHAFRGDWLVLTASTAEEGIKILKEHDVSLVVADHNMPQVTGIEFLEQAIQISPKTVRAILSAYTSDDLKEEATRRAKISAYLEKPWDKKLIRSFIEKTLSEVELGIADGEVKEPDYQSELQKREITSAMVCKMIDDVSEGSVDDRGAKRIFLNYTEPKIREHVAVVRRPTSYAWARAVISSVEGKIDAFETALLDFIRD